MARKLIGVENWLDCITCGCVNVTDKDKKDGALFRSAMKNRQMQNGVFLVPKGKELKVTGKPPDTLKSLARGMDAPGSRSRVIALQERSNDLKINGPDVAKSPEKAQAQNALNFLEVGISDSFKLLDDMFQVGKNNEEPVVSHAGGGLIQVRCCTDQGPNLDPAQPFSMDHDSTAKAPLLQQNDTQRVTAVLDPRRPVLGQGFVSHAKENFPAGTHTHSYTVPEIQLNSPRSTKLLPARTDRKRSAAGVSNGPSESCSGPEEDGEEKEAQTIGSGHTQDILVDCPKAGSSLAKNHGHQSSGSLSSGPESLFSSTGSLFSPRKSMLNLRDKISSFGSTSTKRIKREGNDHRTPRKPQHFEGEEAVVLHDYTAEKGTPFPPDPRKEITVFKGRKLDILEMREDGWCLVRKPAGTQEYWMPGNYLSTDGGKTPYF